MAVEETLESNMESLELGKLAIYKEPDRYFEFIFGGEE